MVWERDGEGEGWCGKDSADQDEERQEDFQVGKRMWQQVGCHGDMDAGGVQ